MSLSLQIVNNAALETLYPIFALAVIFIAAKLLGLLARKLGLPQVVGMVVAGLLIGPAFFFSTGDFHGIIDTVAHPATKTFLDAFASIGVIFILFSSGLETDFKQMKSSGLKATAIACAGVFVPLILGFVGTMFFMPGGIGSPDAWTKDYILNAIFVGTILTATSVGITVETLRELGHLNSKVGQTIVSAAIIDDVIGIIVLSVVTSLKSNDADNPIWWVIVKIVLFLVLAIGAGIGIRYFFKWLVKKYPNKRRTSIFAIAICLLYAFVSEVVFGVASITGAYLAGLMLSGIMTKSGENVSSNINKKIIMTGYLLFSPVFFADIGINADFSKFQPSILLFALVFIVLGVVGKIVGCGAVAKACRYDKKDSMRIGCGMIARGEVALAVYAAGKSMIVAGGGIDPMLPTILLILISSILCPILLKVFFKKPKEGERLEIIEQAPLEERHDAEIGEHSREELYDTPDQIIVEGPVAYAEEFGSLMTEERPPDADTNDSKKE